MTALQVIIKEAKAIRSKSPKMEWKKAVAQASAIYAKKHKGKSPVGKKKAVKKAAKKKAVGKYVKTVRKGKLTDVIYKRKKVSGIKKTATKRAKRKPTERAVLKSIKHAVSVQKSHMSGVSKNFKKFILYKKHIIDVSQAESGKKWYAASTNKLAMPFMTDQLAKKFIYRQISIDILKKNK